MHANLVRKHQEHFLIDAQFHPFRKVTCNSVYESNTSTQEIFVCQCAERFPQRTYVKNRLVIFKKVPSLTSIFAAQLIVCKELVVLGLAFGKSALAEEALTKIKRKDESIKYMQAKNVSALENKFTHMFGLHKGSE